jgi:hypothetical protein
MSRRITTKTEMTDKGLAIQALKEAKITHEVHDNVIVMTSGALDNASLDLRTGTITGDTDYGHSADSLGLLRQFYAEAKVKAEYLRNGTIIDSREINTEGDIVLQWHMG